MITRIGEPPSITRNPGTMDLVLTWFIAWIRTARPASPCSEPPAARRPTPDRGTPHYATGEVARERCPASPRCPPGCREPAHTAPRGLEMGKGPCPPSGLWPLALWLPPGVLKKTCCPLQP